MDARESEVLPRRISVWPEGAPLAAEEDDVFPRMTVYLPSPEYRSGASMLILPGGGYGNLSIDKEGHRPAMYFSAHGIATAVLEYRHAPRKHPVPLLDAQRGLRLLRSLAKAEGLDEHRVGVLGFSAGGHLAGSLATQPEVPEGRTGEPLDAVSYVPNFAALAYPVISAEENVTHKGSFRNLLGENPDPTLLQQLSIEKAVTHDTCPMFLFHSMDDAAVPVQNSLVLADALQKAGVSTEVQLIPSAKHGIGMGENLEWPRQVVSWVANVG